MKRGATGFSTEKIREFVSCLNTKPENPNEKVWPRISVVVPSFNQGRYIERTILSILNQNYPNTEIVIVDGGSTDSTLSVIKKYEEYISHWQSESDRGQSDALNKGFSKATGEILAWQNSDDIYLPGAFYTAAEIFIKNRYIHVVYGNWYSIDVNDSIFDTHYALQPRVPHAPFENMDVYNQAIFWRSDILRKGDDWLDVNLHQLMDSDLMFRFILNKGTAGFYKTNAFLGAFRWHQEQKTSMDKRTERGIKEEKYLEKKYGFSSPKTMKGLYYRVTYRLSQLFESLAAGGIKYTYRKFLTTYRRRGQFI